MGQARRGKETFRVGLAWGLGGVDLGYVHMGRQYDSRWMAFSFLPPFSTRGLIVFFTRAR